MKLSTVLSAVTACVLLAAGPVAAQDHMTPVAPADYLAMENPFDAEDPDDDVIKAAKRIYKKCHGADGDGQGSAAEDIEIKPTDFTVDDYFEEKQDGQLYWVLEKGSEGTEMEAFGPGTDTNLSEEEMWQLITYMRSEFSE